MTAPIRSMAGFSSRLFVLLNLGEKDGVIERLCNVVEEIVRKEVKEAIAQERKRVRKLQRRKAQR